MKVNAPPVPDSVPVKPVEGVTVHALLAIVPSTSVEVQAMGTGAFVKAVAGRVMITSGGVFIIGNTMLVNPWTGADLFMTDPSPNCPAVLPPHAVMSHSI